MQRRPTIEARGFYGISILTAYNEYTCSYLGQHNNKNSVGPEMTCTCTLWIATSIDIKVTLISMLLV